MSEKPLPLVEIVTVLKMSDTPDNNDHAVYVPNADKIGFATSPDTTPFAFRVVSESKLVMAITRSGATADAVTIYDANGAIIVEISLIDGTVDIWQPGRIPEAAERFWQALAQAKVTT